MIRRDTMMTMTTAMAMLIAWRHNITGYFLDSLSGDGLYQMALPQSLTGVLGIGLDWRWPLPHSLTGVPIPGAP